MKKLKFVLWSLALLVLVTACSTSEDYELNSADGTNKRERLTTWDIYVLMTELDKDAQRVLFNELTAEEKYAVWIHRFDDVIDSNDLSNEQVDYIEVLKASISPATFVKDSDENIIFKTVTLEELYEAGKLVFDEIVVHNLTFNITAGRNVLIMYTDPEQDGGGGQLSLCICGIDYAYTCGRYNGSYIEYGKCENTNCVKQSWGCGFIMFHECNGKKCVYS